MKHSHRRKTKEQATAPMRHHWHEMNRKQRRETMRQIQSEELSLEVIHFRPSVRPNQRCLAANDSGDCHQSRGYVFSKLVFMFCHLRILPSVA